MSIEDRLLHSGFEFLGFGLNLLLSPTATDVDTKVSIANIQVGLELLIKYRLAKDHGLQKICLTDISGLTAQDIEDGVQRGSIKSAKFEVCKHSFNQYPSVSEYERSLIDKFQRLRNSIVHFSVDIPREETTSACAHLVLKVVRRIVEPEPDPWLRRYLPQHVYQALVNFPPYIGEAVDDAYKSGKDVRVCFECNNETLTTLPGDDHYCFSCGFKIFTGHAPYVNCPYCHGHQTAIYDSLNAEDGIHHGKCLTCKETVLVTQCGGCGFETFPEVFAKYQNRQWYCESCYEP